MSLKENQEQVDKWAKQFNPAYWPPLVKVACLAEETGEVAREINHLYGNKKKKADETTGELGQELTDVLFTICCIANDEGVNLQQEWDKMMEKKMYGRDKDRYERKED